MTTGRKPTKRCISCGVKLKEGVNWWKSFVGKNHYKCMDCYAIRREENKRKKLQREGK